MTIDIYFTHYGGHCPNCNSTNTAYWTRETEIPDQYNDYEEWQSCHDCKHIWLDDWKESSHTYLLNNGYSEQDIEDMVKRMKDKLGKFFKRDNDKDKQ